MMGLTTYTYHLHGQLQLPIPTTTMVHWEYLYLSRCIENTYTYHYHGKFQLPLFMEFYAPNLTLISADPTFSQAQEWMWRWCWCCCFTFTKNWWDLRSRSFIFLPTRCNFWFLRFVPASRICLEQAQCPMQALSAKFIEDQVEHRDSR